MPWPARPRCWRRSASPTARATTRPSCRAASSSGLRLPARWRGGPPSSWPTSPRATSIRRRAAISSICYSASTAPEAAPSCSSPTPPSSPRARAAPSSSVTVASSVTPPSWPPQADAMTIPLSARLAWRQARGGWRHLAIVLVCVVIGVAAVVAVGTLAADLERTLGREAKALLGGDVELRSTRALEPGADMELPRLASDGARIVRVQEIVAMARGVAGGRASPVELRAGQPGFPLYGRLELVPDRPLGELLAGRGAVVQEELLARLGLRVGDELALGDLHFTIRGVVGRLPDATTSLVTLGPRVVIAATDLEATGLVRPGSRVRYRALLQLPETASPHAVRDVLARRLVDPVVRVSAFDEAQPGLRRFFSQLSTYLGLVSLASLLVGGIGVASSVAMFVGRQLAAIAIFKCLGASSRLLVSVYMIQTAGVALAGALVGVALGVAVQPVLTTLLGGLLPFALESRT